MELNANPFAKIVCYLMKQQDIIKAQGPAAKYSCRNKRCFKYQGRYDVSHVNYPFNFQTFLKTPFKLQQDL